MKKAKFASIKKGARNAIRQCLDVKIDESVVIIADRETKDPASILQAEILSVGANCQFFLMEDFGERPLVMPTEIFKALKKADIAINCACPVEGELPIFRKKIYDLVKKSQLRLAYCGGLNDDILSQGMAANYNKVNSLTLRVWDHVSHAKSLRIETDGGTNLQVDVGEYPWVQCNGIIKPHSWNNLPEGEVFTAPVNANGILVIDGSMADPFDCFGLLKKTPVTLRIKNNQVVTDSIDSANEKLVKAMKQYFRQPMENITRVGEVAFGTNAYIKKLINKMVQDEKIIGMHLAFGDCLPDETGCPYICKEHLDVVILKPTVWVDGKKFMNKGKYRF